MQSQFIGNVLVEETGNNAFKNKEYIAVFEGYPISREGENNSFVEEISNFRTSYEQGISCYKLHSLDFKYVIDSQRWREISKISKITKEFNSTVEQWTDYLSECDNKVIKGIVENIFPKEVTSGRVYYKGAVKGRWILDSCGADL